MEFRFNTLPRRISSMEFCKISPELQTDFSEVLKMESKMAEWRPLFYNEWTEFGCVLMMFGSASCIFRR